MKTKIAILLLATTIFSAGNSLFAEENNVHTFYVDLKIVKTITDKGASGIKIFAASDNTGKLYYIMVGTNSSGKVLEGQVYRQNETGDCPPTCDLLATQLTNGGAFVEANIGSVYIENYLTTHGEVENAVTVCAYSLNRVEEKGYNYMRVSFENNVRITGVKDDGKIKWFAPFSDSCNSKARSSFND